MSCYEGLQAQHPHPLVVLLGSWDQSRADQSCPQWKRAQDPRGEMLAKGCEQAVVFSTWRSFATFFVLQASAQ